MGWFATVRSRKVVEGKSFEDLIDHDLQLLAKAGVSEPTGHTVDEATAGASAAVDVKRLQHDYLDHMPHGHGSHGYVGRGLYAAQLEILYSVFSPSQVVSREWVFGLILPLDSPPACFAQCTLFALQH